MLATNADLRVTVASWKKLQTLRSLPIDLTRIDLLRDRERDWLADPRNLEPLIPLLGLNGDAVAEYPAELHPYCGTGLRMWQYPNQFARYLADLARLGSRSYLEIGIRHGGTFVATVEYLDRFRPLDFAIGVDILPCPSMPAYEERNPRARFVRIDTMSAAYPDLLAATGAIDLVLVDSFHDETLCRAEVMAVRPRARAIALHDITSDDWPGVRVVWEELKASGDYDCREYTDQYDLGRSYMGLGLAVRRSAR